MVTLTIIYFSFMSGTVTAQHHAVPAERCEEIYKTMRHRVKVGRIWGVCHK